MAPYASSCFVARDSDAGRRSVRRAVRHFLGGAGRGLWPLRPSSITLRPNTRLAHRCVSAISAASRRNDRVASVPPDGAAGCLHRRDARNAPWHRGADLANLGKNLRPWHPGRFDRRRRLAEVVFLSVSGGLAGIVMGVVCSKGITTFAGGRAAIAGGASLLERANIPSPLM